MCVEKDILGETWSLTWAKGICVRSSVVHVYMCSTTIETSHILYDDVSASGVKACGDIREHCSLPAVAHWRCQKLPLCRALLNITVIASISVR